MKAALRDASWHNRPDTRTVKRYHVIGDFDQPMCGRNSALCTEDALDVEDVPDWQQCQSNGCKQHWPKEPRP